MGKLLWKEIRFDERIYTPGLNTQKRTFNRGKAFLKSTEKTDYAMPQHLQNPKLPIGAQKWPTGSGRGSDPIFFCDNFC